MVNSRRTDCACSTRTLPRTRRPRVMSPSDWRHGNAHFLRGLAHALVKLGHEVRCYEQEKSWSRSNLEQEGDEIAKRAVQQFYESFPELQVQFYRNDDTFVSFATEQLT